MPVAAAVVGSAVVGGVMSSKAQKSAAKAAANAQIDASEMGVEEQRRQFDEVQKLLKPYADAGLGGLAGQQDLLGINGVEKQQAAIDGINNSAEMQTYLQQGENAILQNASATGGLRGGNTQVALAQFRPQLLNQLINQRYQNYAGLTALGQNAAAGTGNAGMQTASNISNLYQQSGAAQAGAALANGQANANMWNGLTGAIGQIGGMKDDGDVLIMQPINYMLDVQNPVQTAVTGLAQGMQIGQFVRAKEQAEREAIQKQQMQEELSAFASKPNKSHDDYANIMAKFPALAEDFKRSYDVLDSGKQQATFKTASRIYAATASKRFDLAKSILETEAAGYENAGDQETAGYLRQLSMMADSDPEGLQTLTGLTLASTNPSQFKDVLGAINQNDLTPEEINLKRAQTEKTETETLWYGDKSQAEIDNIESQIEDRKTGRVQDQQKMQLQNDQFYVKLDQDQQQFYEKLNQEERKIAQTVFNVKEKPEQRMERLEKVQVFADVASSAAGTAKLAAELINDYKALGDATGAGVWSMARRAIPGTAEYNFSRRVESLKSQAFLISAEKMRGLGSLAESEGKKLENAIASLDLNQSTDQVAKSLAEIAKYSASVGQSANKKAQIYATKGKGYSAEVVEAAKARGVSPAEMQQVANQLGIE